MNNPLRHPEQINPKIAADVQAALEKNRAAGRVVDGDFADSVASSSLADIVKADTAEAKETGVVADPGLEGVANPEIRQSFEAAFAETEKLFGRISLTPPTPEEFATAGVDFARLEREFERMTAEGLEPCLVVTPSLPLTADTSPNPDTNWESLYSVMTKYSAILNNPLQIHDDGEGLQISGDMRFRASDLLKQEKERVLDANDIHTVSHGTNLSPGDVCWTVALLPTTDKPQGLYTLRADYEDVDVPNSSKLATMSQYLTLQAIRIQSGQTPLDKGLSSWLQGTFNDGPQAPYGRWVSGLGRVDVGWVDGGRQYDFMGVRLPVWG